MLCHPLLQSHADWRDRNRTYGRYFRQRVENMGMEEVRTAPRSAWLSPYAERLIGSIRRECLKHGATAGHGFHRIMAMALLR